MKKTLKSVVVAIFCIAVVASTMLFAVAAPGKISSLKASNITYNSITLTWSKASGVDGYEVQQYKGSKWTTIKTTTSTSLKVSSLTTGTTYKFRVRGYDKGVFKTTYGAYTSAVSAKPLPAKVTGLKATSVNYNTVKLTWTKVAGASGYLVQQYKGGKWTSLKYVTTNSYSVTKLSIGTNYSFRVRAYRTVSGKKYFSSAYSSTVKGTPKLTATSTIKVTNVTASAAKVYWSGVSGAGGYEIYDYSTKKWIDTGSAKYYTFSGRNAGTQYSVRIRAYKKVGSKKYYGTYSAIYKYTTAPAVVGNLAADAKSTSMTVTWSATTGAKGYQVYLYDYTTKKSTRVAVTTRTNASVTGLKAGTQYRIRVRAYAKNESYCYGSYATIYPYTATDIQAGAGTTDSAINITWTDVEDATSYKLERYEPLKYSWKTLVESTTQTQFTETSDKNTVSLYRVTAYKKGSVISVAEKELSTKGISITKGNYSVTVNWQKPVFTDNGSASAVGNYSVYKTPVQGYSSYVSTVPDNNTVIGASKTSFTFNLAPGTIQHYMIYAYPKSATATPRSVLVAKFTVKSDELVIDSTNESKTAQLQMLVEAINRTKFEQNDVTVKQKSTIKMSTDEIIVGGVGSLIGLLDVKLLKYYDVDKGEIRLTGTQAILDFMNAMADEGEEVDPSEVNSTEIIEETLNFSAGVAKSSSSGTVTLRKYIEPSGTSNAMAYLYNEHNADAWKNGFSSVSTTKYSNGSYKVVAVLKAESYGSTVSKSQTYYHPGFVSIFDALNLSDAQGMDNKITTVGKTTLTAVIGADGKLTSYSFSSPMKMRFALDESGMKMETSMSGSSEIKYTFTR